MQTDFEIFIYDVVEMNWDTTYPERKEFLARRIKRYLEKNPAIKAEYDKTYNQEAF